MSVNIDTALVRGYTTSITVAHQQADNRLLEACDRIPLTGERTAVDRISSITAKSKDQRHADVEYTDTPHDRRWIQADASYCADLIDDQDTVRMLSNPASPYIQNMAAAIKRDSELKIINAALGNAVTGKLGDSTTAFDTANQQIAVNYARGGGGSNSGLTIGKVKSAYQKLAAAEFLGPKDANRRFIAAPSSAIIDMIDNPEVSSRDYQNWLAYQDGRLPNFLGFEFIRTEQILQNGSGHWRVLAWGKGALCYGAFNELETRMDIIPTKHHALQVYASNDDGAVRKWENGIVEILCLNNT